MFSLQARVNTFALLLFQELAHIMFCHPGIPGIGPHRLAPCGEIQWAFNNTFGNPGHSCNSSFWRLTHLLVDLPGHFPDIALCLYLMGDVMAGSCVSVMFKIRSSCVVNLRNTTNLCNLSMRHGIPKKNSRCVIISLSATQKQKKSV